MNVKIFEKKVVSDYSKIISVLSTVISLIFLFLPNISQKIVYILLVIFIATLVIIYFSVFLYHKFNKKITLLINNTKINIFFGNIFEMKGKKMIAFNEFFDTKVDDVIISKKSLNGKLITNYISAEKIDLLLKKDNELEKGEYISDRKKGKKQKYKLGQIFSVDEYFLLSFSKFNSKNEAELYSNEYAMCLLEMWKNLNVKYAQDKVYIPLLGSGITRIKDNETVSKQDLLEIMLSTLKTSMKTFKEPSEINIVLSPGAENENYRKYNFARIKYLYR